MLQAIVSLLAAALMVVPGNIDLDSRQVVANTNGSISTELSFSCEIDGLEVLLPTVINGSVVSEEEAIEHFLESGEHLGMFCSPEDAELYAFWLHLRQEEKYGDR